METFDFGNGSMARVLEALQSLHLPRYCAPLAFDALFLASLMAGEGCTSPTWLATNLLVIFSILNKCLIYPNDWNAEIKA